MMTTGQPRLPDRMVCKLSETFLACHALLICKILDACLEYNRDLPCA